MGPLPSSVLGGSDLRLPKLDDLWSIANERGALRPWTAVELGRHQYRPNLRPEVERVLRNAATHFKLGRVGAQTTFQPRSALEKEQFLPLSDVEKGDVVLVQGQQGTPQIALLLSSPQE